MDSLLTAWQEMQSPGPKRLWPSSSGCQPSDSLAPGRAIMEACLLSFGKYWGTVCSVRRSGVSVWTLSLLMGTFLFFLYFIYLFFVVVGFYFCLSGIMCFSLLHHINSLRVSLEHSNPIFILRTEDPEGASVHSPHSLWVDTRL